MHAACYLFHRCINESKVAIEADEEAGRTGLFLDIHGHGHENVWAELGNDFPLHCNFIADRTSFESFGC